jgi:hypothetical protein
LSWEGQIFSPGDKRRPSRTARTGFSAPGPPGSRDLGLLLVIGNPLARSARRPPTHRDRRRLATDARTAAVMVGI